MVSVLTLACRRERHILQPHPTLRHQFAVVMASDPDIPELLHPPLNHRLSHDIHPTLATRPEEVSVVVDANRELAEFEDSRRSADTGNALDSSSVHTAMDYSPGSVMVGPQLEMCRDPGTADRL